MIRINYLAVVVAAIASFVVGGLWYGVLFGSVYMELRGIDPAAMPDATPPVWEIVAEFIRCLVVAYVLARFIALTKVWGWMGMMQVGIWLWLGFQAMAIAGSVIHESYPWQLYAIHTGDALVKTLLIAVIIGTWRKRASLPTEGA